MTPLTITGVRKPKPNVVSGFCGKPPPPPGPPPGSNNVTYNDGSDLNSAAAAAKAADVAIVFVATSSYRARFSTEIYA
jgi:hypothetical protein